MAPAAGAESSQGVSFCAVYFTDRQLKLLAFLHARIEADGKAPTLKEIGEHFGFSRVTALQHLRALEKKGTVRRVKHQWRSIELDWKPAPEKRDVKLPITGRLLSGGRLDYGQRGTDFDPSDLIPTERHGHVVRVVGDQLAADGFHDGALLVIEPRSTPRVGELVLAALQDGRAVIRRWEAGAIEGALVPVTGAVAPDRSDRIPARRARILGVVKAQVVRYGSG